MTPKKKYKIRVKAVNKEGESEPLETTETIIAKNPYGTLMLNPCDSSITQTYLLYDKYELFFVIQTSPVSQENQT